MKKLFYFVCIIILSLCSNNVMYGMKRSFEQSKRSATYYELLGVKQDATKQEIEQVFKSLSSLKYHPDKNSGNEEAVAKRLKI